MDGVSGAQWTVIGCLVLLLGIEALLNPSIHSALFNFYQAYTGWTNTNTKKDFTATKTTAAKVPASTQKTVNV